MVNWIQVQGPLLQILRLRINRSVPIMSSYGSNLMLVNAFCLECSYSLRGLAENRCPECGRAFDPDDPGTYTVKRSREERERLARRRRVIGLLLLFTACCLLLVATLEMLFRLVTIGNLMTHFCWASLFAFLAAIAFVMATICANKGKRLSELTLCALSIVVPWLWLACIRPLTLPP
jgi:hypothetical protein